MGIFGSKSIEFLAEFLTLFDVWKSQLCCKAASEMELGTFEKTSGSPTSTNPVISPIFSTFSPMKTVKIVGSGEKIRGVGHLPLDFLQVLRVSWSTPCLRAPTSRPGRVSSGRRRGAFGGMAGVVGPKQR